MTSLHGMLVSAGYEFPQSACQCKKLVCKSILGLDPPIVKSWSTRTFTIARIPAILYNHNGTVCFFKHSGTNQNPNYLTLSRTFLKIWVLLFCIAEPLWPYACKDKISKSLQHVWFKPDRPLTDFCQVNEKIFYFMALFKTNASDPLH